MARKEAFTTLYCTLHCAACDRALLLHRCDSERAITCGRPYSARLQAVDTEQYKGEDDNYYYLTGSYTQALT
jgi:hypothetical protein